MLLMLHTARHVGIATDGASANIARGGLKGLVENKVTWIFFGYGALLTGLNWPIKDTLDKEQGF